MARYQNTVLAPLGRLLIIGLISWLACTSRPARAAPNVWFVASSGGGGACTQADPCALQTAVARAGTGDAIYVAVGVYTGSGDTLLTVEKSIALRGGWNAVGSGAVVCDPDRYASILDGEDARRVVKIGGAVTATLEGFVITRGRRSEGAGVAVYDYEQPGAAPVVRNNVIIHNVADGGWGGGIQVSGGYPLIEGNVIISNTTPYEGGGVAASFGSHLTLRNNLIVENRAGIYGAGVRLRDVAAILGNNTIANQRGEGGHGVLAENSTITLTNNIIVGNIYGLAGRGALNVTIGFNDVWGNAGGNYVGLSDQAGVNGNCSLNPRFADGPLSAYYLSQVSAGQVADSPCMDAGSGPADKLGFHSLSTRTDGLPDRGKVDLGYHHPVRLIMYLPRTFR